MGNFTSNDAGEADTPGIATAAPQVNAHVEIMATPGREQMATGENAIDVIGVLSVSADFLLNKFLRSSTYRYNNNVVVL